MIQRLNAVRFDRFMGSGRTKPMLFGCEDLAGTPAGEYVVKLGGCMDTGSTGLMCELIGSMLARHFGILVPDN